MEQLTGLDASFLYMETPSLHMHVSMVAVLDPTTVPGGYSYQKVRDLIGTRLAQVPVFRRRLVEVPFRLGHPYWVDDESFDLDNHLHRADLPPPGEATQLADLVGAICSRQLDRSKPLWEMHIVEGLAHDRIAVVSKIHHSAVDGVTGAELLAQLFDLEPDPPLREPAAPYTEHDQVPSELRLVLRALTGHITAPVDVSRLVWRTGRSMLKVRQVRRSEGQNKGALPLTTPRTSLNAAITPHRRVAFSAIPLASVKEVKNALDVTVNDVILTLCTGVLRRYLTDRGELPSEPLVATVPVSVHPSTQDRRGTNKISAMFVGLPCAVSDPVKRLEIIRSVTKGAKSEQNALGADVLLNWAEHAAPNVFSIAARTYTRLRLADRHRPIHSLIISNVPGPDFPLYLAGSEIQATFPLGPVMDGAGLNITAMSYRGVINWGFIGCTETVPDLPSIAEALPETLDELRMAIDLAPAVRIDFASPRSGPDSVPGQRRRRSSSPSRADRS